MTIITYYRPLCYISPQKNNNMSRKRSQTHHEILSHNEAPKHRLTADSDGQTAMDRRRWTDGDGQTAMVSTMLLKPV